jgi:hypothetical protein
MKFASAAALALLAATPAWASASGFLVDFEKTWDFGADVAGYYSGAAIADGTAGPNLGVSFTGVSGLSNDALGPYYSNAPSMQGTAYAYATEPSDRSFMNVIAGVDKSLSFFYSSSTDVVGAFKAYSGLNGTGTLLGSFDLAANFDSLAGNYNVWTPLTFSFAGVAKSFDLTASAYAVALDNISGVSPVPEPGTVALMLMGGAALLARTRRRR